MPCNGFTHPLHSIWDDTSLLLCWSRTKSSIAASCSGRTGGPGGGWDAFDVSELAGSSWPSILARAGTCWDTAGRISYAALDRIGEPLVGYLSRVLSRPPQASPRVGVALRLYSWRRHPASPCSWGLALGLLGSNLKGRTLSRGSGSMGKKWSDSVYRINTIIILLAYAMCKGQYDTNIGLSWERVYQACMDCVDVEAP